MIDQVLPFFSAVTVDYLPSVIGGVTTFLICVALVATKGWHGHLTFDGNKGVQKFHTVPTPRVGGLAVLLGLIVSYSYSKPELAALLEPMIISTLPAFAFGFFEDLSKRVGVIERLMACMASGVLAWWLTGIGVTKIGVWGIDDLLAYSPLVVVVLTSIAVGGVSNAINVIDGFHGLASGIVLLGLASLGFIAYSVGDRILVQLVALVFCVNLGFLLVNFPFGKIFLGDGGSYTLGFLLAWMSILMAWRNPSVNPWALVLVCGLPIIEVFVSICRRISRGRSPGQADRLHLHSLIKVRVARKVLRGCSSTLQNASVAPLMWLVALIPSGLATLTWHSQFASVSALVFSVSVYLFIYRSLVCFGICSRR